jgi:hypothetical protein
MSERIQTMGQFELTLAGQINRLHREICAAARTTIEKAIRIGELLTKQKDSLNHGEWLPWLAANVEFSDRTARRYVGIFDRQDELILDSVSDLTTAYRALTTGSAVDDHSAEQQSALNGLTTALKEVRGVAEAARVASFAGIPTDTIWQLCLDGQNERLGVAKDAAQRALDELSDLAPEHLKIAEQKVHESILDVKYMLAGDLGAIQKSKDWLEVARRGCLPR